MGGRGNKKKKRMRKIIKIKEKKKEYNKIKAKRFNNKGISSPQMKGIVLKLFSLTPKKPNSALRKVAIVYIKKMRKEVIAYIPGENHTLTLHAEVLVIKKKVKDLVNVNYRILRGVLDSKCPIRSSARSKFGTPKSAILLKESKISKK